MKRQIKLGMLGLVPMVLTVFAVASILATAGAANGGTSFGKLKEPKKESFLPHHYDNRAGQFAGAADFDDSAEVVLEGEIGGVGIGKATVKQSAAWTWTVWDDKYPCALVYNTARTLKTIHKHAGVTTDGDGTAAGNILDCSVDDCGAQSDHTFDATLKITRKSGGAVINADIIGGSNCELEYIDSAGHGIYDSSHPDTVNRVTTVFKITGGTGKFDGASGDGVLIFTYDTFEPHNLRDASIVMNLE
jgi:hypothetical protein